MNEAGDVKVDSSATKAAEIESKLGTSKAAPPGMATNKEDEARIGFEEERSFYEINYPFIYPSAEDVSKKFQESIGWARYPRTVADEPSRPPLGGINLGISKYSETPDLAFEAAKCMASEDHQADCGRAGRPAAHHRVRLRDEEGPGRLPVRRPPAGVDRRGRAAPGDPRLQRHLAGDPEDLPPARRHRPGVDREQAQGPHRARRRREDLLMEAATATQDTGTRRTGKKSDRARSERKLAYMLCAPAVIAMLIVTGYPIGYAFYLSLQKFDLRFPDDKEFVGFQNYADVLTSSTWWSDVAVTSIITVISVSIELVLGMAIALVMHRAIFGRGPVRAAILVPYGIVTVVAAFAWRYAFDPASGFVQGLPLISDTAAPLTNQAGSLMVIILAEVWKTTPFMALLLLAGLALVPDELHEAAKVDGASAWQRFTRITLPLMRPAILVALLFRTLDAFRIFDNVFIIQPGGALGTETVSILGYNVLINRVNLGLGSAISILIFLCVILIATFFVKVLGTSTAQQTGEAI